MKTIKIFFIALLAACALGAVTSCKDNFTAPVTATGSTISGIAGSTDSLKAFSAALAKTGLTSSFSNPNSGSFTVFATTNYAMVKYLRKAGLTIGAVTSASAGDSATKAINKLTTTSTPLSISGLLARLSYHIVSSAIPSTSITGAQGFATLSGATPARISLSVGSGNPPFIINADIGTDGTGNGANILDSGTPASNGVIYSIDRMMAPISTATIWNQASLLNFNVNYGTTPATVSIAGATTPIDTTVHTQTAYGVGAAATDSDTTNYNLFTMSLVRCGLATSIVQNGVSILPDYTVFAPTDGSFFRYLTTLSGTTISSEASARTYINSITGSALTDYTNLIKYHIVAARMVSTDLKNTLSVNTWLTDKAFTVNYDGTTYTLTDLNASSQNAKVSAPNKLTNAGIVHSIQRVLQPQ